MLKVDVSATLAGAAHASGGGGGVLFAHALGLFFSFADPEDQARRRLVLYDPHERQAETWADILPVALRRRALRKALGLTRLFFLCGSAAAAKGRCRQLVFEFLADNAGDLVGALAKAVELK